MSEDDINIGTEFCPTCGDPTVADNHRRAALNEVRAVLSPVLDWFQSDETTERPTLEILREVVEELQSDREYNLLAADALRKFLAACTGEMIHHRAMGPAFAAAMKAKQVFERNNRRPGSERHTAEMMEDSNG